MKDLEKKIEEAATGYSKTSFVRDDIQRSKRFAFIAGAKSPEAKEYWQQGMYTEKEVKEITTEFFYFWYNAPGENTEEAFVKWFEQNKKK